MARAKAKKKEVRKSFLSLVRYVPPEKAAENPFHEFVRVLTRHHQSQTTSAGAVRWTTFPVEYALASGFWPVLKLLAEELKYSLATPKEVSFVATKVNQLLCASILVIFPKVEMMVTAFEKDVVRLLERAIVLGYRPGMDVSLFLWKQFRDGDETAFVAEIHRLAKLDLSGDAQLMFKSSVALFFWDIIKVARKKADKWKEEYLRLVRLNVFSEDMMVRWSEVDGDLQRAGAGLELFDLSLGVEDRVLSGTDKHFLANTLHLVPEIERLLRIARREIDLARKLPVNVWVLQQRLALDLGFSTSIREQWVHSQLLITAGNLPEREWILAAEFPKSLAALKKMTDEELVSKTLKRWREKRRFSPKPEDEAALGQVMVKALKYMRIWTSSSAKRAKIDADMPTDLSWTMHQIPTPKGRF